MSEYRREDARQKPRFKTARDWSLFVGGILAVFGFIGLGTGDDWGPTVFGLGVIGLLLGVVLFMFGKELDKRTREDWP